MATPARGDSHFLMKAVITKPIPEDILKDSLLAHVAAAYFAVGKQLERKTQCSATRGFVLNALREGVEMNQNQIATGLGLDRTVVHRTIKGMIEEGLASEKQAATGRALMVRLTAKGERYRDFLIAERRAADEKLRKHFTPQDRATLVRLLKVVAESEI